MRDVPLREDAHSSRENNGVQILATLRSLAINALRLDGIWSITEGIAALAHDIKGLLRLLRLRKEKSGYLSETRNSEVAGNALRIANGDLGMTLCLEA